MLRAIQYLQGTSFLLLGFAFGKSWLDKRGRRLGHLVWATLLIGASRFLSVAAGGVSNADIARWLSIGGGAAVFLSMYAFALFLADYRRFPEGTLAIIALVTAGNIVLLGLERAGGTDNPIPYDAFVQYVRAYLVVGFFVLGSWFVVFALRGAGLRRVRMLALAAGFLLLCLAGGLSPGLVTAAPSHPTVHNIAMVARGISVLSAPLLYIGLLPPTWLSRRLTAFAPAA